MADEDFFVKASNLKGRSASVCYAGPLPRPGISDNIIGYSPPITPPANTGNKSFFKSSAAVRTHSIHSTAVRSVKKSHHQYTTTDLDGSNSHFDFNNIDSKATDCGGSGSSSPVPFRRKGSHKRANSVYQHSSVQRKSAAFLDIPKNSSSNIPSEPPDGNSYRLRSFSYTSKGIINRGDSFRRKHGRSNSILPPSNSSNHNSAESAEKVINHTVNLETDYSECDKPAEFDSTAAYNVSVLGAKGVGKTSLISQFMTSEAINAYDRQKDVPSEQTVSIMLNGNESELRFHEFKNSKSLYQKKLPSDAFLIIYSIGDKTTFQKAEEELTRLHDADMLLTKPAILVGNKVDLARSRAVSLQDGKCLACTFRVKFIEISVGINHNVDELLVGILNQIRLKKQLTEDETLANSNSQWYKSRGILRATMKARQMFTWIFGREDSKFRNCENLSIL